MSKNKTYVVVAICEIKNIDLNTILLIINKNKWMVSAIESKINSDILDYFFVHSLATWSSTFLIQNFR